MFLLLLDYAAICRFSLIHEAQEKFYQCERREWGPPDAEGVSEHVREEAA